MNQSRKYQRSANRLPVGARILEAATLTDTTLVAARLSAFTAVHRRFEEAQAVVSEVQQRADAITTRIAAAEAAHDAAVEDLVYALLADRKPRRNAFSDYGDESPSGLRHRGPADKVSATAALVAAVAADPDVSAQSRTAADALRAASQELAALLEPLGPVEAELRRARAARDAIADEWDDAVGALRRGARVAADEGATNLYSILFGSIGRTRTRPKRNTETTAAPGDDQAAA
jgi:hypothetical protein